MFKMKRPVKVMLLLFSVLLLLLAAAAFHFLPKKLFREPSGPYQVGTTTRYAVDASRDETLSADPDDKRELFLQIWYPANDNDLPRAGYGTHMTDMLAEISRSMKLPSFLLQQLESVRTYSALDAELSDRENAFPVLLFSHGLGLYGFQNTFQMEELASHGYIVVAIQHPYHSLLTVFPDGRKIADLSYDLAKFEQFVAMNQALSEIWVKDARFVLDDLERLNQGGEASLFAHRLDLTKVGMFGHSFGGAAAAQTLLADARVKAALNLDGTLTGTGQIPEAGFGKPFMQLSAQQADLTKDGAGGFDLEGLDLQDAGISREDLKRYKDFLQVFNANQRNAYHNGGYHVWLKGASHYTFTDIVLYSPLVPFILKDKIDTVLAHRTINEYTLAFFNQYLLQMESPLLRPSSSKLVEVTVGE